MPKKFDSDKKTGAQKRASGPRAGLKPISINDLLKRRPGLQSLTQALPAQQSWLEWLRGAVAVELSPHLVSVVPKTGELVVFADSAAWCARLRYVVEALLPRISERDPALARVRVRVAPRGQGERAP